VFSVCIFPTSEELNSVAHPKAKTNKQTNKQPKSKNKKIKLSNKQTKQT